MTTRYSFSDNARQVLTEARAHAGRLGHAYVSPDHILLGLTSVADAVAATTLVDLGQSLESLGKEVEGRMVPSRDVAPGPDLPYTSGAKRVLDRAMSAARDLGHPHVGTEHILLGLVQEDTSTAAVVLAEHQLTAERLQTGINRVLATNRQSVALRAQPDMLLQDDEGPTVARQTRMSTYLSIAALVVAVLALVVALTR